MPLPTSKEIDAVMEEYTESMQAFIFLDTQETEIRVKKIAAHHRMSLASEAVCAIRQSLN